MADGSSIVVKFGGDIGELQSATQRASANLKDFGASGAVSIAALNTSIGALNATLATQISQTAAAANSWSSWLTTARDVALTAAGATVTIQGLVEASSTVGAVLRAPAEAVSAVSSAADSAAKSMLANAASQAYVAQYTPLVELANTGLAASFGRGVVAVQDFLRAAEILKSGLVAIEGETIAAAGNMSKLEQAAIKSGLGNATELLRSYTEQLAKIPGLTNEAAAGIVATLGSIQNFSGIAAHGLVDIIPMLSKSGDDAKTLAAAIASAFSNPQANGKGFLETLGGVSAQLQAQFDAAVKTSNVNKQQAALYDALIAKVRLLGAEKTREFQEELAAMAQLGPLGDLLALGIRKQVDEAVRFNAELDKSVTALQRQSDTLRSRPLTGSQIFTAAQPTIASARPQIDQIEEITSKLDVLYQEKQKLQNGASPFGALATPESARELERNKEATDALEDSLRKLQDARKGGSATELLENAQAQARAKFTLDELSAALALAASLDKEAAGTKNLQQAYALTKRAAEERQKGEELAAAVTEASSRRAAAAEEEGSARQVAAIKRANAAKRAVTEPGSAERVNLDAADEAADRAHQDRLDADAQAGEDTRFKIKQDGLAAAAVLIREEAQAKSISYDAEKAMLLANEADGEAAEREHYAKIEDIWGEGTSQFREAQKQIEQIAAASALKRATIEKEVDKQIVEEQKRAASETASTLSSAVMGMITGQQSLASAAKQVATKIVSTYLDAGIKLVLENSGQVGQMVSSFVSGEALKTAAVTTGVTARTGVETAGAAASSAETIAGVLHSIAASAAETFAGIFGFLSPVMGPGAAVPAAAGEAAVLAVAAGVPSMAVGAWSLPSDLIAQVHRGEMIVPAAPAAAMRSALSGGQSAGGAVHVYVTHAPVINAVDAHSVREFYRGSERILLRQLNDAVRRGAHLGLSKLS